MMMVASPVMAEDGVTAVANPQATSSGNVTNQAVQVTNTNLFQNTYGGGVQCQGTTLSVSPFVIQGFSAPDSHVKNDFGVAATISVPLDGEAVELCKNRARIEIQRQRAETDKAALDYNLVRALKCTEMIQQGAFMHPSSPYAGLCEDIVALGRDGRWRNGIGQVVEGRQKLSPPQSKTSLSSLESFDTSF